MAPRTVVKEKTAKDRDGKDKEVSMQTHMYFVAYFMKKHSVTITEDDKSNSACTSAALKIPVKIETQRK